MLLLRRVWIHRQRDVFPKRGLQPFDRALFVSADLVSSASDAERADHLPVDDDGYAARVREKIKVRGLARSPRRIVFEVRTDDGRGLPRL